jgi:hypothetical protein
MRHDRLLPLADQLADAARSSLDQTTHALLTHIRYELDDHVEAFFTDPSSERLQDLVGFWTRAVKLLKDTPDIAKEFEAG